MTPYREYLIPKPINLTELLLFTIAFAATYLGVAVFRRWSVHTGTLDFPNDRSSHDNPVPRGGGLVMVLVSLALYAFTSLYVTSKFNFAFVVAAALVALISWLDDLYTLSSVLRLFVHSLAAIILLLGSGYWQEIYVPVIERTLNLGPFGFAIGFIWIVWMVNAYNFMDGIDGLAGSQAVISGIAWLIFGYLFQTDTAYYFGGIIAFSSAGFLIHNWAPARVFMGDVGSAFLGFTFAALPLMEAEPSSASSSISFFAGVAFVWFFLFDTVFTFIRRALRGERVWTAHREHLYQRMLRKDKSHSAVTLLYAAFAFATSASMFLALKFGGGWELLMVLTMVLLSAVLLLVSWKKKKLT